MMPDIDKRKFGAFVAQLRKEKGYTQKALADCLHISDKAVSKWETGASIPDIGLLMPLADMLGVTVTELLNGERMAQQSLSSEKVEDIVKTAISYKDSSLTRAWQEKSIWGSLFLLSCVIAALLLFLLYRRGRMTEPLVTNAVLTAIFGAYFCFFVRMRLPDYYDQDKISGLIDGAVRLNFPGLYFNNSNWPYIVRTGRAVMLADMVLLPLLALLVGNADPALWAKVETPAMLVLLLGGLFIPMYVVGRKYE